MSKRSGHSSYEDLIEQGFLTEAVVISWRCWDGVLLTTENFSLKELVEAFDYHHISKSPAVFDMVKMKWMNSEYIKAMEPEEFYQRALPYMKETLKRDYDFRKIAAMVQTRIETFAEIPEMVSFFEVVPEYDNSMYKHKKMKTTEETSCQVLREVLPF